MDYSKWDKLKLEDDDDEFVGDAEGGSALHTGKGGRVLSYFVELHPEDDGEGLNPVYLGNPMEHRPTGDPTVASGMLTAWGVNSTDPRYSGIEAIKRRMVAESLYGTPTSPAKWKASPEENFVQRLMELKQSRVLELRPERAFLLTASLVLRVELLFNGGAPLAVWRRVRVPGGISLDALHDRALVPAMGWSPFAHGWLMTDQTDGSVFGPADCCLADMKHVVKHGGDFLPADEYGVADLVSAAGQSFLWTYDLGDAWYHRVTLEEVVAAAGDKQQQSSEIVCLGGENSCPPEDSVSCHGLGPNGYKAALEQELLDETHPKHKEAIAAIVEKASNHKEKTKFDPREFSIEDANSRIAKAAELTPPPKPKVTATPGNNPNVRVIRKDAEGKVRAMSAAEANEAAKQRRLKEEKEKEKEKAQQPPPTAGKGKAPLDASDSKPQQPRTNGGQPAKGEPTAAVEPKESREQTTIKPGVDKRAVVCAVCGKSPKKLQRCSRCKQVFYCSVECQAKQWPKHQLVCIPKK